MGIAKCLAGAIAVCAASALAVTAAAQQPLPQASDSLAELTGECQGALVATLLEVGEPEPGPPGAADYSSRWRVKRVLRGEYGETAELRFRVQTLPHMSAQRPPAVGSTYILISYKVNANQIAAILEADKANRRKVRELLQR
jgi:hypothetical protein